MANEKYQATGTLINVSDEQQVSEKFRKRDFVIKTDGEYPQELQFQLTQDRTSALDSLPVGSNVTVHFNLRGRPWEKDGNVRWFNSLEAWKIERVGAGQPAKYDGPEYEIHGTAMQQPAPGPSGPTAPVGEIISDLPF